MGQPLDSPAQQLPLGLRALPAPRRTDGVVGRNGAVLAALDAVFAEQPGPSLFLWGAPGSGKTFWLTAFASEAPGKARLSRCGAPEQPQSPAQAFKPDAGQSDPAAAATIWLIDDVHLATAEEQAALFTAYNRAMQDGARMVFAADRPPRDMPSREDLRTRLGQCLVFELAELTEEEMRHALRDRALALGWLSHPAQDTYDHLFDYLLTRLPRNLSLLTELLHMADRRALSLQRAISLPLVRSLIDEALAKSPQPLSTTTGPT
ncbi:MAG: DnaA ATPase domain-containing protein [Burkholderiaceae bacterium]